MRQITLAEYLAGRDVAYASDYTERIAQNAKHTVEVINEFLSATGFDAHVSSGWRPPAVNIAAHGALHSKHLDALCVDLYDHDERIDDYCSAHPEVLEQFNLWRESPSHTKGWCHLAVVAYNSWAAGKSRTFDP